MATLEFSLFFQAELVFGVRVKICGDQKHLDGPCLIIMNHRTRFDWLFLWSYMIRMGNLRHHKIILKQSLKKIPLFGMLAWYQEWLTCLSPMFVVLLM